VELNDQLTIAFTKKDEARPLTSFKVDYEPCMIEYENGWRQERDQNGNRREREVHPSEMYTNHGFGCTVEPNMRTRTDPRYYNMGERAEVDISEYEV